MQGVLLWLTVSDVWSTAVFWELNSEKIIAVTNTVSMLILLIGLRVVL